MAPWFVRGAQFVNGSSAGVFDFDQTNGYANINNSFRVFTMILKITKKIEEILSKKIIEIKFLSERKNT